MSLAIRRPAACLVLLVSVALWPSRLLAGGASVSADLALLRAQQLESERRWPEACRFYEDLLRKERDQAAYREGYQRCLRHFYLARRHRDSSYRQALAKLAPSQALDVYEQVLSTVGMAYVDRPRADLTALFQNGVKELEFAVDEPEFLQTFLPGAADNSAALLAFQQQLRAWRSRDVANRAEARDAVLAVARAAREAGLASKQSSLVPAFALEFACGACNALDEYTLFVTPGHDLSSTAKSGPSVRHDLLPDNLSTTVGGAPVFAGWIRIHRFQESTLQEVREAVIDLSSRGAKGLILDLRGNPGGLFLAAVQVAELFVGEGVIVYSQGQIQEYNHPFEAHAGQLCQLPILVLVDGDTASAAEVLAGALKDLGRARILGQQTFGKGSIQAVFPLNRPPLDKTPAAIRLTVAKLLSPAKQPYTGHGINPDIEVPPGQEALEAAKIHMRPLVNPVAVASPG